MNTGKMIGIVLATVFVLWLFGVVNIPVGGFRGLNQGNLGGGYGGNVGGGITRSDAGQDACERMRPGSEFLNWNADGTAACRILRGGSLEQIPSSPRTAMTDNDGPSASGRPEGGVDSRGQKSCERMRPGSTFVSWNSDGTARCKK